MKKLVEAAGPAQHVLQSSMRHNVSHWFPLLNLPAFCGKFNLSPFQILAIKHCDHNLNSINGLQVVSLTPFQCLIGM